MWPEENQPINLAADLIELATYRLDERLSLTRDPLAFYLAYAQDNTVYDARGVITPSDPNEYERIKHSSDLVIRNQMVNKFGLVYSADSTLRLHRSLADILVSAAIDLYQSHGYVTVVMDGLRTYDAGVRMQENRPDLVASGLLAKAGTSAHNRAMAVDSKLFCPIHKNATASQHSWDVTQLMEVDEHGHLDDEQAMSINSRYYTGPMSDAAKQNRLLRLCAWQRASVKHRIPLANLLSEFWDDRLTGGPADMWRIAVCRGLCLGMSMHPDHNPAISALRNLLNDYDRKLSQGELTRSQSAKASHEALCDHWQDIFPIEKQQELEKLLGSGGGNPPALTDFIFHEWLETIYDRDLAKVNIPRQAA